MKRAVLLLACLISFLFLFSIYDLNSNPVQKKKDQRTEEYEVTVTLKLVKVYVTDKKGNPIMDLDKEDFELYDNGKLRKITDFEKHVLFTPSSRIAPKQAKAKPPIQEKKLSRKFFLFFDFAFNSARGIKNSKEAALYFIDSQLQPSDNIGVISYSRFKGLTLHEDLTTDHQKVRKIVERFEIKDSLGRAEEVFDIINIEEKEKDELYKHRIQDFIKRIINLAKVLGYIEGTKHILFFSTGIISRIFMGSVKTIPLTEFGDWLLLDKYEKMLKELSSSSCSIYAVHSEGPAAILDKDMDMDELGIEQLQRASEVTGGKYFGNINEYEKIMEEIHYVTGSYYVLGYYIDEKWDGKYHRIKVEVKRKGCEVRVHEGYFNPKHFTKYSKIEKKIHLLNLALDEKSQFQTPFHLPLVALPCLDQGKSSLLMISKIPMNRIQEAAKKTIEIANFIFDKEDNQVESNIAEVDLSELPETKIYQYSLSQLSPGEYKCRVVIRNVETGKAAVASSSVVIPEIPDYGLMLNPPLLLSPGEKAFYIENTKKRSPVKIYSSLIAAYPYDASQYTPLIGELPRGISRILALVRCAFFKIQEPKITISACLIHQETGKQIGGRVSILNKYLEKDSIISLLELQIEELVPGKYRLDFVAKERETQSEANVSKTFRVR